ncbi:tetratricopeptide repeat protein [Streptomyces sp. CRN 30]|uniref:tetratricopeptide repeat protein n=1 Tax=Streptomyces sp. CRN 30 TaxID=3075613 RepID=UPI002A82A9C3|nr:tetratricopeptide repeat protein [Streptomyces sp. CRN 30]
MARLSRDKKRDRQRVEHPAAPETPPVDVRVARDGTGSVDGVPVAAVPGEEIQQTVLNRLQDLARAADRPVPARIHDERIGYVVPLRVDPDGSSHLLGDPSRTAPPADAAQEPPRDRVTHVLGPIPGAAEAGSPADAGPSSDGDPSPTFRLRSLPEQAPPPARATTPAPAPAPVPAPVPLPLPPAPGTVAPPTGEFGPPPRMDGATTAPRPPAPRPVTDAPPARAPKAPSAAKSGLYLGLDPDLAPDMTPAPARGFDAVAEAVLGDEPLTAPGDGTAPAVLAEPTARVHEAVRSGRTEDAARLADEAVTEATRTLGPDHPEVLRLRELTAYIAYLSGDPVRALRTALELARTHHRAGDAEAAYGNVHSAATAWRAVRDPERGLELGHELIDLWTGLAVEEGPAADDIEELESARARMGRLTARARAAATTTED